MTDRKSGALELADTAQRGALTTRGTGDLVSRGLADLERSAQATPALLTARECFELGRRLSHDAIYAAPSEREHWWTARLHKWAEALIWYRRAAEEGHLEAQIHLAVLNDEGSQGARQDDAEAARWWRAAADQGCADAQIILGVSYANGRGVRQDDAEAVRWLRRVAGIVWDRDRDNRARKNIGRKLLRSPILPPFQLLGDAYP